MTIAVLPGRPDLLAHLPIHGVLLAIAALAPVPASHRPRLVSRSLRSA